MTPVNLALRGVSKAYGGVQALKDVTFDVLEGEVHALLGENGAGKSTLMGIAAGAVLADTGSVEIAGVRMDAPSPTSAQALGLAVVYQHPAIVDELTVAENLALSVPPKLRGRLGAGHSWAREQLLLVGCEVDPKLRGGALTPADRHRVEIAKALVTDPRVLVLDEPTAALSGAEAEALFTKIREITAAGTSVVYISHRIPEVVAIADRITVLRDGEHRGTVQASDVDEDDILQMIVGRRIDAVFPQKPAPGDRAPLLEVRGLSGDGFRDVDLTVGAAEIVGLSGVEGNGQREVLRALAGLEPHDGDIRLEGRPVALRSGVQATAAGIAHIPGDRRREGVFDVLSVRENVALSALDTVARHGVVSPVAERELIASEMSSLGVKAASPEAGVLSLSGGNQQKVVFARALLTRPSVLLCDEPTQGVDAGARAEIYRLLRARTAGGAGALVVSSDALELEGLCDRVVVFSRGTPVATLEGDAVTEENIVAAAVKAGAGAGETGPSDDPRPPSRWRRVLAGERTAVAALLAVGLVLALYTTSVNDAYLTALNLQNLLFIATALILVAGGQLIVMLAGGVDLSVGPLMALVVVLLSYVADDGTGGLGLALGIVIVMAAAALVGLAHGVMVRWLRLVPIITTLSTYIILQGVALLLRPRPEGAIAPWLMDAAQTSIGFVPLVFLGAAALFAVADRLLRVSRFGLALRAVGSDETAAHRVGVKVTPTVMASYVLCSLFTAAGAIMLATQVGIGDATVGQTYTLNSIAAVVLGGASIYGGRGSFVGAFIGALLLTQVINALPFLQLSEAWQYFLPALMVLGAGTIYARSRGARNAALASR